VDDFSVFSPCVFVRGNSTFAKDSLPVKNEVVDPKMQSSAWWQRPNNAFSAVEKDDARCAVALSGLGQRSTPVVAEKIPSKTVNGTARRYMSEVNQSINDLSLSYLLTWCSFYNF
jgi:Flp pilus assembly protein CpaB